MISTMLVLHTQHTMFTDMHACLCVSVFLAFHIMAEANILSITLCMWSITWMDVSNGSGGGGGGGGGGDKSYSQLIWHR